MKSYSLINTPIPHTDEIVHWGVFHHNSAAFLIAELALQQRSPIVVIVPDNAAASTLNESLPFFLEKPLPILYLPDYETLPYDSFSPNQQTLSERMDVLSKLLTLTEGIVIISIPTLMQRLAPPMHISGQTFNLKLGDKLNLIEMRKRLTLCAYRYVSTVFSPGEFTIRGAILDLFPMGSRSPYRIELFDDDIHSIRSFDPDTQLSDEKIEAISLMPAKEFPTQEEAITHFREQWRAEFSGNPLDCPLYQQVSEGIFPQGIEYYLPLFFNPMASFFDYIADNSLCIFCGNTVDNSKHFWGEVNARYEQYRYDITRPLLAPAAVFIPPDQLNSILKSYPRIHLHYDALSHQKHLITLPVEAGISLALDHKLKQPLKKFIDYLVSFESRDYRILICAETAGRREILLNLLHNAGIYPKTLESWNSFYQESKETLCITVAPLVEGFILSQAKLIVIAESQLMGEHITRSKTQQRAADPDTIIRNLSELQIGDPVVHIDHGVGRYLGLQHLQLDNIDNEFLTIAYANEDKLYVPVSSLHLINRYSGVDAEHAPLNKLGTDHWAKIKREASQKIRDVAAELLSIYAKRKAARGVAFQTPNEDYQLFANAFPFEETPDQTQAISATLNDMCSTQSMDRLICGDVGFGKTEVAMRATFVAVQSGKQAAILVPTTLLAQQHYQNFCDRFADWPVRIEVLSRFKTAKEQSLVLDELAKGKIDIIIGTHKLIQKRIRFHALGLVIIDEEHRFGVRQKEYLKSLRAEVDILALTATPIPRTLNMAMNSVRDLSIIATPPAKRLSIKTFVRQYNLTLITEAIQREILRGGQVYFIHNNIQTIQQAAEKIKTALPEAKIAIAHGQLRERELERIMSEFYHHHYNVLICTTIIETGIDIPTANTIIIDKADHFGLAQLHQLRGRVGRSHHQAYAYLLTHGEKAATKDAEKRLEAIASLEELGAGFMLATHDLEIRGAGELLGEDQSGQIQAIGFSLYTELLEKAVKTLERGETLDEIALSHTTCEVNLRIPALIPEDYLPDVHSRLILYKRIANAASENELESLQAEMIDRFGLLKAPTQHLFTLTALKLQALPLGIKKIDADASTCKLEFIDRPAVDPTLIIKLIQNEPARYQLLRGTQLRYHFDKDLSIEARLRAINTLLMRLSQGL
ncbi:MAG: transcription-repair coupling factor [Gammaproteobacteria bacterium]|jgi:transcription-repair coupling factor (superfamily II helicase)|nr:transcription-repair coupling factor [Gammaproteobacteria bacterium]